MGNLGSTPREEQDIWWTNGNRNVSQQRVIEETTSSSQQTNCIQRKDIGLNKNSNKFNELVFEMERKHEKRREILAAKKKEFEDLREEVRILKEENELLKSSGTNQSQEEYTKELQHLKEDNEHLRLLLSSKQVGGVLTEELDKVLHENTMLKGELKDKVEELVKVATLLDKNRGLKISIAEMQDELQKLNGVVVDFEKEREEYKAHVVALKDVISVSKKMLLIRESQLKELREKVESIEESLSGKEMNILSQDLRLEYERQLQSIRNLRTLYEERQMTDHKEKQELKRIIEETKKELETEQNKNKEAEERIEELEEQNSQKYDQIKSLESNLGLSKAESRQYQAELTVINQLFSEILLGFNSSQEIDLDKLTKHLEEHHELLQNIVSNEISSETSFALPKVLLDLVNQVITERENKTLMKDENLEGRKLETIVEESESETSTATDQINLEINSVEEIVKLLPKVWRVLIELLSHQKVPTNTLSTEDSEDENPCYKTVQTPKGPSVVVSVSQTFIRLKDLILEKKALEKETGHLKQLNTHLENRLQDQEKRLGMVTSELNKTWHVVGKLQKQHQLLHTQEKILRYELAQKRKLLTTLKEELEYSREKWQEAREKNSKTEKQWRQLRVEFASRRNTTVSDECSTSGYSDERCSSSDDEPEYDVCKFAPKPEEDQNDAITQLNKSTDTDQEQTTPTPTYIDASLVNNSIQDKVTLAEKSIEIANSCIESKLQSNDSSSVDLETSSPESATSRLTDASSNLVSSVIDEAIASILQNSNQSNKEVRIPLIKEELTTSTDEPDRTHQAATEETVPSTSASVQSKSKSLEELLAAKEKRLKRLEGQCEQLVQKVTNTTQTSVIISNKLDDLHEVYGESSNSEPRRTSNVPEDVEINRTCDDNQE